MSDKPKFYDIQLGNGFHYYTVEQYDAEKAKVKRLKDILRTFLNSDDAFRVVDVVWLNTTEQALREIGEL